MGTGWIQIGLHTVVTLLALFTIGLRLEHRLTRIETDLDWLKNEKNPGCDKNQGCDESLDPQKEKE